MKDFKGDLLLDNVDVENISFAIVRSIRFHVSYLSRLSPDDELVSGLRTQIMDCLNIIERFSDFQMICVDHDKD